ncbi:hydroxysteroid 11-beta-dehydrogenase 1-like protein B [Lineus longissimus]|uniref:hydroxysteroid 11-beta-dehydrogenase 1-like protein B n=1 Tax=Lineus longissimus TaxID=88925 RepID=UPI002B4D1ECF
MGLKLFTTTVVLFAMWIAYSWIDLFDPVMVRGKRVLVTGASTGIGEQLAYQYAGMGAKVMVTARREDVLKKVVAKCKEISGKPQQYYVTGDMSRLEDAEMIMQAVKEKLGGLDILVLNHVGPFDFGWFSGKENLTRFNYKTTVNYISYVHLAAYALPLLRESPGSSIVVISSVAGVIGMPPNAEYAASKFALRGFFQSLAAQFEILEQDTSVTVCFLGPIDTASAVRVLQTTSIVGKNFSSSNAISLADVSSTALAVVKAGALKQEEMFYPYYFKVVNFPGLQRIVKYFANKSFKKGWRETSEDTK